MIEKRELKTVRQRIVARAMIGLLLFALVALSLQFVPAAYAQSVWDATFGGAYADAAYCVQQTSDSGYIIAGSTESFGAGSTDSLLVKIDSNGNQIWNRTYGGSFADETRYVRQTSDGGYILAGFTESVGLGDADFWLVKTEVDGALRWSKTYGGTLEDRAYCVRQTSDMGYIMAGFTESFGTGGGDFWLIKTDSNGNAQWNKTYGGTGLDQAFSIVQTCDGGYVVAGEGDFTGNTDFWIIKTNYAGALIWNRTYGGTGLDTARSIDKTNDEGYAVAGWTNSFGKGGSDFLLVKTDTLGNTQWSKTYGNTSDEEAYSVQQTGDGGYMVAGSTKSYGLYPGVWNFWLVKTNAVGDREWDQVNGWSSDDRAYSAQQTNDGGYILAGSTESKGAGLVDFWVTKTTPHPDRPPEEEHDVAILSASPSRTLVGEGASMTVNVTVENQGIFDETSMIHVYANTTLIGEEPVLLASRECQVIAFALNTSGFAKGSYDISAKADQVLEEVDTADNIFTDGKVKITIMGDAQGDGKVDASDLSILEKAYGAHPLEPLWNPYCDFNSDERVDLSDLFILGKSYGQT